jgi:predicted DCC family thiol-disulfide oxidoreductase YuxK
VLLADMPEEERLSSMHIVDERGRVFSAGDAVIKLLSLSSDRKVRLQALVARLVPPAHRKVEREYQRLAARRGELSERVDDVEPTTVRPRWTRLPGVDQ